MKKQLTIFLVLFLMFAATAQVQVTSGKVQRFENFKSKLIDARNIDVWLPDGYSEKEKYAVLYMHDGQALYDTQSTWNKQAWEIDEVAGKLIAEGKAQKFIVVGIWNNGAKRHPEYFPQKPFENLTQIQRDTVTAQLQKAGRTKDIFKPYSDLYLQFLVTEVKPFIDKTFSTKRTKKILLLLVPVWEDLFRCMLFVNIQKFLEVLLVYLRIGQVPFLQTIIQFQMPL